MARRVVDRDENGTRRLTGGKDRHGGTPQGGVASPMLANSEYCGFLEPSWRPVRESAVKPVGKPDAGNPHVRFDERGWETGRRSGVCARAHPRLCKEYRAGSDYSGHFPLQEASG